MAASYNSSAVRPQSGNGQPASAPAPGLPSTSTFSFKAPFPVSPASAVNATALKHRRVSLASPSSPRIVKPWSFRDEMGLQPQNSEDAATTATTAMSADAAASSPLAETTSDTTTPPIDTLPEKKGKMRKIDPTQNSDDSSGLTLEKKPRKKWSSEETQMLVDGCNKHGVGNWKTILQDPEFTFHDRSAVDLKDRFRTYFPDAYKKHYPNARTHLSSKIRSTFADGTSLFEKTRSKRRRPFTEAEDRALKAGYEKHGTTWATIVKDPIFQEQNRRSTDLRDRFRNAFPTLYQAAGYKPRTAAASKKRDKDKMGDGPQVMRAADDQLAAISAAGPVRSRRRAHTSQGLLRGGTKSVPQSTACSEDEESSGGEEESESSRSVFKTLPTPVFVDGNHDFRAGSKMKRPVKGRTSVSAPVLSTSASASASGAAPSTTPSAPLSLPIDYIDGPDDEDMELEMQLVTIDTDPLNIPDFLPNNTHSDMETWSSGLNTPTHSSTAAWSTAAASPTSSHVSDFFLTGNGNGTSSASSASSPFIHRRNDIAGPHNMGNMIGKSAWGTNDWFSPNPRLDSGNGNGGASSSASSSSYIDASSFSPASPFSFHPHLNHGVLDRYDLFPPYMPDSNSSEVGHGDTHTTFSDEFGFGGASGTSKGYHSQIAGDLISGGARMHQHSSFAAAFLPLSLSSGAAYGGAGAGFGGTGQNGEISGLGLEGIHPMQLHGHGHGHSHSTSLAAIDELGLTGISLNDRVDSSSRASTASGNGGDAMDDGTRDGVGGGGGGGNDEEQDAVMMEMAFGIPHSPEKAHHQQQHQQQQMRGLQQQEEDESNSVDLDTSLNSDSFGLDDLVDMSELHATPPATPVLTQPRPLRRASGPMMHNFDSPSIGGGGGHHARSISVPPSEARNVFLGGGIPMSMDDVGLHSMHGPVDLQQQQLAESARTLHAFFNPHLSSPASGNGHGHGLVAQQRHKASEPMRLSNSTGSMQPPMSPILRQQVPQNNSVQQHIQQQHQQHQQQASGSVYSSNLLTPSSPSTLPPSSGSTSSSDTHPGHGIGINHSVHMNMNEQSLNNDLWRNVFPSTGDSYNLSFLDLHTYYAHGPGHHHSQYGALNHHHHGFGGGLDVTLEDYSEARQGLALDLAQTAVSSSSSLFGGYGFGGNKMNLGASLRGFNPSPVGTIRQRAGREKTPIPARFVAPSQTVSTVNGELSELGIAGATVDGHGADDEDAAGMIRSSGGGSNKDGTIRSRKQPQTRSGNGALGRSMSHHRGQSQSAVCPQDLMLRNDNKRKRASWDGGIA